MSNAAFNAAFNAISTKVEFKKSWSNGTGYYNNAVYDFDIVEICKTFDHNGRKMIIIPTVVGNVVVFERYNGGSSIIVANAPLIIERMAYGLDLGTSLGEEELAFYLGDSWGTPHIGERLSDFLKNVEFKKLYREKKAALRAAETEKE